LGHESLGAYDNGHKVDGGVQPNPSGHDRYLEGGIYLRPFRGPHWLGNPGSWFFGAGYRWNQLSTTRYTKGSNGILVGGGYDLALRRCSECRRDFSMRIALDWLMAGNDWQNGSHGPQLALTIPSARENRHLFFEERLAVYSFHETVTEPTNVSLTQQQQAQKDWDGTSTFGVMCRF
jgi:hypothetical protein